jgi:hypothetical protein
MTFNTIKVGVPAQLRSPHGPCRVVVTFGEGLLNQQEYVGDDYFLLQLFRHS